MFFEVQRAYEAKFRLSLRSNLHCFCTCRLRTHFYAIRLLQQRYASLRFVYLRVAHINPEHST